MDSGACMDDTESNGNTLLHMAVVHNLPEMYKHIKSRWLRTTEDEALSSANSDNGNETLSEQIDRTPSDYYDKLKHTTFFGKNILWKIENKEGYTPFTLAAKLGQENIFSHLVEEDKLIQWKYGPVTCMLFPLDQFDLPSERSEGKCALELIIEESHFNLLRQKRVAELIKLKWNHFARIAFIKRMMAVIIYLVGFTAYVIERRNISLKYNEYIAIGEPKETQTYRFESAALFTNKYASDIHTNSTHFYYLFAFVIIGALYKFFLVEVKEMRSSGFFGYWSASGTAFMENFISVSYCISIFLLAIFSAIQSEWEFSFIALASVLGYAYLFFFLLAFKLTGPMVIMVYKMLCNDILKFCVVYSVFLIGFGQAFFVLNTDRSEKTNGMEGWCRSVGVFFLTSLGDFDFEV